MADVAAPIEWTVAVGETLPRREVSQQYGGGWYGGIEPSRRTPNVLIFSKPEVSERYGYAYDGWHPDGTYHYTGEGQQGDQEFVQGNRAIRDHVEDGRALRLFWSQGTGTTYLGEFTLPEDEPYRMADAPDRDGARRSVIVFRLQPVGDALRDGAPTVPDLQPGVTRVPVERQHTETFERAAPTEPSQEAE